MQFTIKMKLILIGLMAAQAIGVVLWISMKANQDVVVALSSGDVLAQDGPRLADLRIVGREMVLDAIPSPAERRTQRYSEDRQTAFDRRVARIRGALQEMLEARGGDAGSSMVLLVPRTTLLELERKVTVELRRAVESGEAEEDLLFVLESIRMLAGQLDAELMALAPEGGDTPAWERDVLMETLDVSMSMMLMVSVVGLCTMIFFIAFIGFSITRPLALLTESMSALADGRVETDVPGQERPDEIGLMAKAVQRIKEALANSRRR